MSQRGGSVNTDVRYGPRVLSPMVPDGEADVLVAMEATQIDNNRHRLRPGGRLITPETVAGIPAAAGKSANVALLGVLSHYVDLPGECWRAAIRAALPEKHHAANLEAFAAGRAAAK